MTPRTRMPRRASTADASPPPTQRSPTADRCSRSLGYRARRHLELHDVGAVPGLVLRACRRRGRGAPRARRRRCAGPPWSRWPATCAVKRTESPGGRSITLGARDARGAAAGRVQHRLVRRRARRTPPGTGRRTPAARGGRPGLRRYAVIRSESPGARCPGGCTVSRSGRSELCGCRRWGSRPAAAPPAARRRRSGRVIP